MALWPIFAVVGGGLLAMLAGGKKNGPPAGFPTQAQRAGWVQLGDGPGLQVRQASHAFTTPAVAVIMAVAGQTATSLGGLLQIADISRADRGAPFPPHVSHEWGRDLDIGYRLDAGYPTPADVAVDPRIVQVMQSIAPWIDRVGVNAVRAAPFQNKGFKVSIWDGHVGHLHLRLRADLTIEPRARVNNDLEDIGA